MKLIGDSTNKQAPTLFIGRVAVSSSAVFFGPPMATIDLVGSLFVRCLIMLDNGDDDDDDDGRS